MSDDQWITIHDPVALARHVLAKYTAGDVTEDSPSTRLAMTVLGYETRVNELGADLKEEKRHAAIATHDWLRCARERDAIRTESFARIAELEAALTEACDGWLAEIPMTYVDAEVEATVRRISQLMDLARRSTP